MIYGILFWATVIILSTFEGMQTWSRFDEICLRLYARTWSTIWYWEYLEEERKK